jgi:protein-disulfide isomerase
MRRLLNSLTLIALMSAGPALAGGLGAMSAEEKAAFRAEVRAYLLENPEVLVEAMDVLNARTDADSATRDQQMLVANKDQLMNDPASYVGGNLNGDITVIEFMDYQCGYCKKAHEEVTALIKADGNIRFIVKEYPILGDASVLASRFAISVLQLHGPDAYIVAYDAMLSMRGAPDETSLARLATTLNLDPAPIMARMNSAEVTAVIEANHSLGQTMEVSGTPTFVIGGSIVRGYVPLDGMQQIVAQERRS